MECIIQILHWLSQFGAEASNRVGYNSGKEAVAAAAAA